MRLRARAIADDALVEQAAADLLLGGASAVAAVVGGFLAAAGARPGVMLAPVTVLVAGVGIGARAFDGRSCQPGRGVRRPRGFLAGAPVPDAARVAVPEGVLAALVARSLDQSVSAGVLLRAGIAAAEQARAPARVALLRRLRDQGGAALRGPEFTRPLLRIAGPSEGGLLTQQDFDAVPEVDHAARETALGAGAWVEAPWGDEPAERHETAAPGNGHAVLAVDVQGVFAALAYREATHGLVVAELELVAPLLAVPIMRGVVRVRPGTRLPAPSPVALGRDPEGRIVEAAADPSRLVVGHGAVPLRLVRRLGSGDVEAPGR